MHINKRYRIFRLKLAKKVIKSISFIILFELLSFPVPILAAKNEDVNLDNNMANVEQNIVIEENIDLGSAKNNILPKNNDIEIIKIHRVAMTAYNSEVGQTDDSPCITANGFNLCKHGIEDTIAANFLPMGTKVKIPDQFGDRVFIVRDRMHPRFQNRVDVWMIKRTDALKFGLKVSRIEVIK